MVNPKSHLMIALDEATTALAAAQNMVVVRDNRIAELEAALKEVDKWYITEQKKFGDPPTIDKTPTLDALLAAAKREALEAAAVRMEGYLNCNEVSRYLRRMAREVKP